MTSTTKEDGLSIWERVQATDPAYTKSFTGHLGFEGTAVNPTYVFRKATEVFGPIGIGWGADVIHEEYVKGAPIAFPADGDEPTHAVIHKAKVEVWYMLGDKKGVVRQYGGTQFIGRGHDGKLYTDDDAAKKSMTDGMLKCLSLLGFGGDIHLGLYDDAKYVQGLEAFFAQQAANAAIPAQQSAHQASNDTGTARNSKLAGRQAAPQAGSDGKHSARYLQWKERLLTGIDEKDLPRTREVIRADEQLSELERALLLGSKELKAGEQATKGERADSRSSRNIEPAVNQHEFL